MIVELKKAPEVRRIVIAAFPDYRKHKSHLSTFPESGMDVNSYWDGGSKTVYAIVDMTTGKRKALPTSTHPYFEITARGLAGVENADLVTSPQGSLRLKHLPEGYALVSSGTFCGKPATASVYINSANLSKLLGY